MIAALSILSRFCRNSSGRVLREMIVSASASLEKGGSGAGCMGAKIYSQPGFTLPYLDGRVYATDRQQRQSGMLLDN